MNRLRVAGPVLILGLSLLSGCANVGHGEILARLGFGPRCSSESCGTGQIIYEGPDIGDPGCCAGAGGQGGPMILSPGGMPNLAPPPRLLPGQAPAAPADPTSLIKSR